MSVIAREPLRLSVGQVRARIVAEVCRGGPRTSGVRAGEGARAGRLFHQAAAALFDTGGAAYWRRLEPDDLTAERVARHLYDRVLGPELLRQQSGLENASAEVLAAWNAMRSFAAWFAALLEQAQKSGGLSYDGQLEAWTGCERLFAAEQEIEARVRRPGGSIVAISGRADLVVTASNNRWCVVEFKVGAGCEEADAAQACLYRYLLSAGRNNEGAVALVRFRGDGQREERVFFPAETAAVEERLLEMIRATQWEDEAAPRAIPADGLTGRAAGAEETELGKRLLETLEEFGAPATLDQAPVAGPAFARYFVTPKRGIEVERIRRQAQNLQVRLNLSRAPFINVTPDGRLAIDLQRSTREFIPFERVRPQLPRDRPEGNARMLAGVDLFGLAHFVDFRSPDCTHVLVAGTAGSGKTQWLTTALASLVQTNRPATLRLVLVDPKRNAFPELKQSPYLWKPDALLYPPEQDVVAGLEELIGEMEERYRRFEQARAQDLAEYLERTGEVLPHIVCFCDEYADLVLAGRRQREQIEQAVARLGQKARAAGIHLVLATQRPSRDIVRGILKANMPCRVALRVTDALESRIILDRAGAELLLGSGDLLFSTVGDPVRLQAPYLEAAERQRIFCKPVALEQG